MSPPTAYATLSSPLPSRPYILGIAPSPTTPHLLLRHPSAEITIVDNQTLQPVEQLKGGHTGLVTALAADQGALWSSGKDAGIVGWDERSRRAATVIKAFVRKPLPVLALTVSERDHLVIGGTEQVSSEAHILFYDMRNPKVPAYSHSSTHSDDITHLSLLPSTSSFLRTQSSAGSPPLPDRLLLSSSTDGLVALSNMKENDEDEALLAEENWGQSIADAGSWLHKGTMKIWARSDMDSVATWSIGKGVEDELELQDHISFPTETFKFRSFNLPKSGPNVTQTAAEERQAKMQITSDYLIDVVPSLGTSKNGGPMSAVGTNGGDIILQHHVPSHNPPYTQSAYFLSGPSSSTATRGHQDVVRALYHDLTNEAIYTGSEDGVLSGWSLASLPDRLVVGDPDMDDVERDKEMDDESEEESEIESEDEEEDEENDDDGDERMDVDADVREPGPRYGPIIGASVVGSSRPGKEGRKEKRKEKRFDPY